MAYLNGKKILFSPHITLDGYDSGYTDGYEEGYTDGEYDGLEVGLSEGMRSMLALCADNSTSLNSQFSGFSITNFPSMDLSDYTNFSYMLSECGNLTIVGKLDTPDGTNFRGMFSDSTALWRVVGIDFSSASINTNTQSAFSGCSALTDLTINGTLKTSLNLSSSTLLNTSIQSVLTALSATPVASATITFTTSAESVITGSSELNALYQTALTNGWTISFA